MALRSDLAGIIESLIASTKEGDAIELDALGEAIGARAISQDEINAMLDMIDARGRHIVTPDGGHGEATLKIVLDAARSLRIEHGRPPRAEEIATRAGISITRVHHALSLARVMQR
jgi:hypothetical protein